MQVFFNGPISFPLAAAFYFQHFILMQVFVSWWLTLPLNHILNFTKQENRRILQQFCFNYFQNLCSIFPTEYCCLNSHLDIAFLFVVVHSSYSQFDEFSSKDNDFLSEKMAQLLKLNPAPTRWLTPPITEVPGEITTYSDLYRHLA